MTGVQTCALPISPPPTDPYVPFLAQPVEDLSLSLISNLEVVGLSSTMDRIFHIFLPTLAYAVGAELFSLSFG